MMCKQPNKIYLLLNKAEIENFALCKECNICILQEYTSFLHINSNNDSIM